MRRAVAGLAMMVAVALSGCASNGDGSSFDLVEFSISGPSTLSNDTTAVDVTNSGEFPHTLVVTDSKGQVVAATGLLQPGDAAGLELGLNSGTYSFTCRIVAQNDKGELIDHFESGMSTTVTVTT